MESLKKGLSSARCINITSVLHSLRYGVLSDWLEWRFRTAERSDG